MEGLNRVTLLGVLGRDSELKQFESNAVLNFSLACGERYKDKSGEWKERTEWVNVAVWGKRGEALHTILVKGTRVCIEGRLSTRSWDAKDGTKRYSTEVVTTNVVLLGGKGGASGERPPQSEHDRTKADGYQGDGDDDIPF